ncbi:MAG TPA: gliding motility-associated C-terminal domain-containing protein, partial [Chitinophagales bacterium]|nr:gliding motility-associated C-terminal domain-containing protein [Chitinophagales bacterium]
GEEECSGGGTTTAVCHSLAAPLTNTVVIPNAFSPNNDGVNDTWGIKGNNITRYQVAIYDRWGQKVFETNDSQLWEGSYPNGVAAELDVYVFYLQLWFVDGEKVFEKGNITLVR